MPLARSRVTSQGQISVPANVRRKLGIVPGAVIEWDEADGNVVVRRAGKYTSLDIHRALFGDTPPPRRDLSQLKQGIAEYVKKRHARD